MPTLSDRRATLLLPPERLKVSEWAEKFAYVPDDGSNAEPGKYRLARMPWQAAMLDDCNDPSVRDCFWMMCSQYAGKTMALMLICEFAIHRLHRSLLVVRDTRDRAAEWMNEKFLPLVESTPCMEGLLADPRQRNARSKALSRKFPGGTMKIIGAKSRGAFRSTSCGIVLCDEIDAYEATKEGDPIALADRAAKSFPDAIKLKASTTTLAGFSRIERGFLCGDQQYYFVPCPVCGQFQHLKTEQMKFSFTEEESARTGAPSDCTWAVGDLPIKDTRRAIYVCEHCHRGWTDSQRIEAIKSGHPENPAVVVDGKPLRAEWRATAPFNGVRSRALNGMYGLIGLGDAHASYLHRWAEEFLEAKRGGRETLMAWTNMFKNAPFEDEYEKLDWQDIQKRAEDYGSDLPPQVCWINWGMDVHPDRIEILFYGWGPQRECWCLAHHVEYGDFDSPAMQGRVWDYLAAKRWKHPVLGDMTWSSGLVDSGHQTKVQAVYSWCAKHASMRVWSCKGFEDISGTVYERKKERRFGGMRFNLNTDYLKTLIFDRLRNTEPGPNYIHFPKGKRFNASFYAQLCSEKRVTVKQPMGGAVMRWQKLTSATRNEVLDCTVYAFGNFEICRQEEFIERRWKEVESQLHPADGASEPPPPAELKLPELRNATHPRPARKRVRVFSPFRRF